MLKNAFYFTIKALFILKIFKCLSCLCGHVELGFTLYKTEQPLRGMELQEKEAQKVKAQG